MLTKQQTTNLKGISIVLVMIGHFVTLGKINITPEWRFIATFSVDAFLAISGYGLTKSFESNGLKGFFRKRIASIAIPFIIANVIIFAIYGYKHYSFIDLVKTITFINFNLTLDGTMWFIYFILMWYFLFYIVFLLKISTGIKAIVLLLLSVIIHNYSWLIEFKTLSSQFMLHSFSFPLGVAIAAFNRGDRIKNSVIASIAATLFIISFYSIFQKFTMQNYVFCCALYAVASIFVFSVAGFSNKILALSWIGSISYEIYLVEGVLMRFNYSSIDYANLVLFISVAIASGFIINIISKRILRIVL